MKKVIFIIAFCVLAISNNLKAQDTIYPNHVATIDFDTNGVFYIPSCGFCTFTDGEYFDTTYLSVHDAKFWTHNYQFSQFMNGDSILDLFDFSNVNLFDNGNRQFKIGSNTYPLDSINLVKYILYDDLRTDILTNSAANIILKIVKISNSNDVEFEKKIYLSFQINSNTPSLNQTEICKLEYDNTISHFKVHIADINTNTEVDSFKIYRYFSGDYNLVGSVHKDSLIFIDTTFNFNSELFITPQTYIIKEVYDGPHYSSISNATPSHTSLQFNVIGDYLTITDKYKVNFADLSPINHHNFDGYYVFASNTPNTIDTVFPGTISLNSTGIGGLDTTYQYYYVGVIKDCENFRDFENFSIISFFKQEINTTGLGDFEPTTQHKAWMYGGNLRFESVEPMHVELYTIEGKQIYSIHNIVSLTIPLDVNIVVCVVSDQQGRKSYKFVNVR